MTTSPPRILHLEHDPSDAALVRETLETDGLGGQVTRVATEAEFVRALDQGGVDIVLADLTLPSVDGLAALSVTRKKHPDLPFIFVAGALGEHVAIELFRNGATDYVLKDGLSRLVPSVRRAVTEANERAERQRAEALLSGEKSLLEMIAGATPLPIILDGLCRLVEEISEGSLSSILLLDADGQRLRHGAAPSLPRSYTEAIDGSLIGPVGGLPACWSAPILASDGRVLGTFAIYTREPRDPTAQEHNLIGRITNLASIAVERRRADEERQAHRSLLETMDRVNRAIQGTNDLDQMLSGVLDVALSILDCDRAWVWYPCDPDARSQHLQMQRARPGSPDLFPVRADVPMAPETADMLRAVRASRGPVRFGPGWAHPLSATMAMRGGVQSTMIMALYPKGDQPYTFGLSQCSHPRAWTAPEERLFQAIGRRVEDALASLLVLRSLAESERRLEAAQRLSHVGHWERDLDLDRFTLSDETYRIYGLDPQRRGLASADVEALVHPADRPLREAAIKVALETDRYDVEYRAVRPDGEVRFVYGQGRVLRDESGRPRRMFGTVQDMTERKRAEQSRVVQYAVTQILAESATVAEATPRILQAVCEALTWDLGALWRVDREAGLLRCFEVWHAPSVMAPRFEATSRATTFPPGHGLPGRVWSSGKPAYIPDIVNDLNFPRAPVAVPEGLHAAFGFPIVFGQDVLGVMEFFSRDIRPPDRDLIEMMATIGSQIGQFIERKRGEAALGETQGELARVARLTTMGELTASIAHEINQPLGAVVNNASAGLRWLAMHNLEEARRSVAMVIADGHRAAEIIGRIRALAQKAPPRKDWLDLNDTIRDVIAMARSELQSHGVLLRAELAGDVPVVLGDRIQLQQVVLNLIVNAIEAMSSAGDGRRELVVRSARAGEDGVLVAVSDSGPGPDPKGLDRLFEAFYTTKAQGLGLGLAISRRIIEAHAGRLWATANTPRGAVFQFTLPVGEVRGP